MRKISAYLKKYFILGGLTPAEYESASPEINQENYKIAKATAYIMAAVFACLFISSLLTDGLQDYRMMYGLGFEFSILELITFKFMINEKSRALRPCMLIQNVVLYLLGILVSTYLSPDESAVAIHVMLVGVPLFPINKPYKKALVLVSMTVVFILCASYCKPPEISEMDIINAVIYCCISIIANSYLACFRLSSINLRGAIERERDTDALTGLNNKAALMKRIDNYLVNDNIGGIFMVIDIDDFKHFNDTYGHETGDFVLEKVGEYIDADFRASDIKGRFGGDEFVIFMKNTTDLDSAARRAEVLMKHIANCIELPNDEDRVHASIGIALWEDSDHNYGKMLTKADKALYKAKEKGKNQYVIYNKTMD